MHNFDYSSTSAEDLPYVVACMPAYQSGQFISRTLDSVLSQNYPNIRIFISIDVCEDNTLEVCQQYQQQFPQITLFEQTERQGWLNNTNFLFQQVEDPYFFYMQHDDVIDSQYVSQIMEVLINTSNAILGYSDMTRHHYKLPKRVECFEQMSLTIKSKERVAKFLRSPYWYVVFRGIVSRKGLLKAGLLQMNGKTEFSADFIWLINLAYYGNFIRVPKPLYDKYVLDTSLAESWSKGSIRYFKMYRNAAKSILSLPAPLSDKVELVCSVWFAFVVKVFVKLVPKKKNQS